MTVLKNKSMNYTAQNKTLDQKQYRSWLTIVLLDNIPDQITWSLLKDTCNKDASSWTTTSMVVLAALWKLENAAASVQVRPSSLTIDYYNQ